MVGNLPLGGEWPVRVQSMTNTDTLDTKASVAQSIRIIEAGGEMIRLTAQGIREAENLLNIREGLRKSGFEVPLVADIHFNPAAAEKAAYIVDKVRINPGNYVDKRATFKIVNLTEKEYSEELERIHERLLPLIDICRRNKTVIRVGINHGSLSDRIMSRFGNTPEGMTASALEFISIFRAENFNNLVLSMKSSNPAVMVGATRQLVVAMQKFGYSYPLHLGVTEAGEGEDGRIRSAAAIGALLMEGIGDTIRVSLSEPPEDEIPVALEILKRATGSSGRATWPSKPLEFASSGELYRPEVLSCKEELYYKESGEQYHGKIVTIKDKTTVVSDIERPFKEKIGHTDIDEELKGSAICFETDETEREKIALHAATLTGRYFIFRQAGGLCIRNSSTPLRDNNRGVDSQNDTSYNDSLFRDISFAILQATEARITKNRYISCPTCGRTKYDLQTAVRKVKEATKHLSGLKIAVMGCIVNGPGEMAGADYGYVGSGEGKINIYRGSVAVLKNIPEEEAVDRLLEIIETDKP